MCRAYYVIWKNQRSAVGIQNHVGLREARLTKTLFLITGASIFAWLPFQILSVLTYLGVTTSFPYLQLTTLIVRVLQFSNSLINVAIYPFRIPEFKNTLWQILCCHRDFHSLIHPLAGSGWSVRSLLRLPTLVFPSENLTQESPVWFGEELKQIVHTIDNIPMRIIKPTIDIIDIREIARKT